MANLRLPRGHVLLALLFVASRLVLYTAGLRLNFSLDWMWLGDPADLRDRLLETLYYFHAFPPGMNFLTGILLKLGGEAAPTLALLLFWAFGLVLVHSLFYLALAAGLSQRAAFILALGFALLPQTIYFEHLYLYEEPVAALLCLSVALFHAALTRESFRLWLAFFTVCAVIGITRSTFHLVWFAAMFGAAMWCVSPAMRRRVVIAATVPAALLLGVYFKNLILFGTFGTFTYGPSSYAHVTVSRLPSDVRASWVRGHKLSPFAAVSPYAGPREYLRVYPASEPPDLPRQLTQLERPTVHAPNFNHWVILEANRQRAGDAWYYMRTEPLGYAVNVLRGIRDLLTASTEWHPYTGTPRSPHYEHRRVLGAYEAAVNRVLHGVPVAPIGLYAFLPVMLIWTASQSWRWLWASDRSRRIVGAMLGLCVFNVVFVGSVSSVFTFLESSRYRYQVESLIWVVAGVSFVTACDTLARAHASRWRPTRKTVSPSHFP